MGEVEHAVRRAVRPGQEFRTPGQGKPFEVAELRPEGIVLLLGKGRHWTPIPWEALEGVPDLLAPSRAGTGFPKAVSGLGGIAGRGGSESGGMSRTRPRRDSCSFVAGYASAGGDDLSVESG